MAHDYGYPELAKKSESYEICFVPDNDYRGFLKRRVPGLEERVAGGNFVNKEGQILGQHKGYPFYTVGQRKGLDIALGEPVFVKEIVPETNTVVLGYDGDLDETTMKVRDLNIVKYQLLPQPIEALTKIRYKDKGHMSKVTQEGNYAYIQFYESVQAIAPGQSAVFYEGNDLVGGGFIARQ